MARSIRTGSLRAQPRVVVRCIAICVVAAIILAGLVALVVWLVVRPGPIEYAVEDASSRHFNLTSPAALNATFDITLTADNTNRRVSLQYDWVEVDVLYEGDKMASSEVAPFRQPRRNVTRLHVHAVARSVPLTDSVARDLKHDRSAGRVSLAVTMRARVQFRVGRVNTDYYAVEVFCSPVVVGFSSPASKFQSVSCDVDL